MTNIKPGNVILSQIIFIYLSKNVDCVICRTDNPPYNTTCPDVCCSSYSPTPDSACCSSITWNSGVYIGLSVPIFCCVASILAGVFYCCLIVKPNTRFIYNRSRLSNFRNRIVTPHESLPTVSVKDDPPTYNELYSNELPIKVDMNTTRINSPEPPPYSNQTSNHLNNS